MFAFHTISVGKNLRGYQISHSYLHTICVSICSEFLFEYFHFLTFTSILREKN